MKSISRDSFRQRGPFKLRISRGTCLYTSQHLFHLKLFFEQFHSSIAPWCKKWSSKQLQDFNQCLPCPDRDSHRSNAASDYTLEQLLITFIGSYLVTCESLAYFVFERASNSVFPSRNDKQLLKRGCFSPPLSISSRYSYIIKTKDSQDCNDLGK